MEHLLSQQLHSSSSIYSNSEPVALGTSYWCTSKEALKHMYLQRIVVSVCAELSPQQHSSSHADVIVSLSTWTRVLFFNEKSTLCPAATIKLCVNFITCSGKRICCKLRFMRAQHCYSKSHFGLLFVTVIVVVRGRGEG